MPDAPDGGRYQLQGKKDTLSDLGELAARIGAHDVWDRRGQVVWYDRFESGLSPWRLSGSGTGATTVVDAGNTEFGGYAALLTAGSDGSHAEEIIHAMPVPEINRWGLEAGVSIRQEFEQVYLTIGSFDGTNRTVARLILNRTTNKIQIATGAMVAMDVGDLSNPISSYAVYQQLKVVGDFETGKYVRVIYNTQEIDVSAYDLAVIADASNPHVDAAVRLIGRETNNDIASVGHVIATVGEP